MAYVRSTTGLLVTLDHTEEVDAEHPAGVGETMPVELDEEEDVESSSEVLEANAAVVLRPEHFAAAAEAHASDRTMSLAIVMLVEDKGMTC